MDKQDVVHIHNDTLLSNKKDGLPFVTIRMDLEGITLSEIRQRKTNTMWSHMWNLKNKTNKTNENNQWLFKWKFKNMTYRLPWWLSGRVHLPVQETWVQSLVWEDPTCCWAAKPWATAIEPVLWSLGITTTEPLPRAWCSVAREATAVGSPHAETRE